MIMREWLSKDKINDLKAKGKLRETPDIMIFGAHRKVIRVMSAYAWITEHKDICLGYAVKDFKTGEIL